MVGTEDGSRFPMKSLRQSSGCHTLEEYDLDSVERKTRHTGSGSGVIAGMSARRTWLCPPKRERFISRTPSDKWPTSKRSRGRGWSQVSIHTQSKSSSWSATRALRVDTQPGGAKRARYRTRVLRASPRSGQISKAYAPDGA